MFSSTQDSQTTTNTMRQFRTNWADEEDWDFSSVEEKPKKVVKDVSISRDSHSIIMKTFGVAAEPETKKETITFKKGKRGKQVMDLSSKQETLTTQVLQKETRFSAMLVGYKCWLRSDQEMRKRDGSKREEELRAMYQLHFLILGEPIKENHEGKKYVLRMARGNLAAKWALGYKLGDIGTITIGDIKKPSRDSYDCVEPLVLTNLPQGFWLNRWGAIPDEPTWVNHDKESRGDFSPEHVRKCRTLDITWVQKSSIEEINKKLHKPVVIEAIWNYIETYKQYKYPQINNLMTENLEDVPKLLLNLGCKVREASCMASALRGSTVPLPVAATQRAEPQKTVSRPEDLRSETKVIPKTTGSVWQTFDRNAMVPIATAPEPEKPIEGLRRTHLEDVIETIPEIKLRVITITRTGLPFLIPIQNSKEVPTYRDSLKTMNWTEIVPKGGGVISMEEASKNKFPTGSVVLGRVIWNFSAKGGVGDWNVYISESEYRPKPKSKIIPFKAVVPKKPLKVEESSSFIPKEVELVQTESSTMMDAAWWLLADCDCA